jgi:Fe-S-cluster-containing dehydrogenase component
MFILLIPSKKELTMQKSFIFDLNKCTGCQACQIACVIENELEPERSWRQIHTFNEQRLPGIPLFHLSLACNHCLDAPCMKYCPALAYSRETNTGAVLINEESCIGCKYCSWVCPYDAPKFDHFSGVMTKCTFCHHRLQDGLEPACVALCPTGVLQIGDYDSSENGNASPIPGFPETGIRPAIRFIPLRENQMIPEMTALPPAEYGKEFPNISQGNAPAKITLASEWTLTTFTFIAAMLVGWFAASLTGAVKINLPVFLIDGLLIMGLSAVHLGKKFRSWRVILNWRNSWLSREIIFFSAFPGLATIYLLFLPGYELIGVIIALVGFAALFSIDRVYQVIPGTGPLYRHSAGALLSGLFFAALIAESLFICGLLWLLKMFFYIYRKVEFKNSRCKTRPLLSALRVGLGFLLPLILLLIDPLNFVGPIIVSIVIGEIIDRCEFYMELDILTPRGQMKLDLEKQ